MDETNSHQGPTLIERIQNIYVYLEYIAHNDGEKLSNGGKANLRRAQAELQRIRLLVLDLTRNEQDDTN